MIDKAINLTRAFFSKYEDDFFYISALSFDDERETDEEIIKLFNNIYDSAKNESYLKVLSESFQSYLYGEIPLPANSLSIHYNSERFWDISKLIMGHGGVLGQVFFMVNLKLNLLLYPHDNTGFGCLSLGGNNKICKDYLMYIEKEKEFNVVIKS